MRSNDGHVPSISLIRCRAPATCARFGRQQCVEGALLICHRHAECETLYRDVQRGTLRRDTDVRTRRRTHVRPDRSQHVPVQKGRRIAREEDGGVAAGWEKELHAVQLRVQTKVRDGRFPRPKTGG